MKLAKILALVGWFCCATCLGLELKDIEETKDKLPEAPDIVEMIIRYNRDLDEEAAKKALNQEHDFKMYLPAVAAEQGGREKTHLLTWLEHTCSFFNISYQACIDYLLATGKVDINRVYAKGDVKKNVNLLQLQFFGKKDENICYLDQLVEILLDHGAVWDDDTRVAGDLKNKILNHSERIYDLIFDKDGKPKVQKVTHSKFFGEEKPDLKVKKLEPGTGDLSKLAIEDIDGRKAPSAQEIVKMIEKYNKLGADEAKKELNKGHNYNDIPTFDWLLAPVQGGCDNTHLLTWLIYKSIAEPAYRESIDALLATKKVDLNRVYEAVRARTIVLGDNANLLQLYLVGFLKGVIKPADDDFKSLVEVLLDHGAVWNEETFIAKAPYRVKQEKSYFVKQDLQKDHKPVYDLIFDESGGLKKQTPTYSKFFGAKKSGGLGEKKPPLEEKTLDLEKCLQALSRSFGALAEKAHMIYLR